MAKGTIPKPCLLFLPHYCRIIRSVYSPLQCVLALRLRHFRVFFSQLAFSSWGNSLSCTPINLVWGDKVWYPLRVIQNSTFDSRRPLKHRSWLRASFTQILTAVNYLWAFLLACVLYTAWASGAWWIFLWSETRVVFYPGLFPVVIYGHVSVLCYGLSYCRVPIPRQCSLSYAVLRLAVSLFVKIGTPIAFR